MRFCPCLWAFSSVQLSSMEQTCSWPDWEQQTRLIYLSKRLSIFSLNNVQEISCIAYDTSTLYSSLLSFHPTLTRIFISLSIFKYRQKVSVKTSFSAGQAENCLANSRVVRQPPDWWIEKEKAQVHIYRVERGRVFGWRARKSHKGTLISWLNWFYFKEISEGQLYYIKFWS